MALYKAELLSQLIRVPRARPRPNRSYTPPHRVADELLDSVMAHQSVLLCGVPGSGKSTTIDLLGYRLQGLAPNWLVVRWRAGQSPEQVLGEVVESGGFATLSGWGELVTRLRCSPVLAGLLLVVEDFTMAGLAPVAALAAELEEVRAPISLVATMACALGSLQAHDEAELRKTFRMLKPLSLPGPPGAFESLLTDGYFERREWDHWSTLEADADLAYQFACLERLKLYDSEELARIVVYSGYPLHPTVTFLLPRLAERLNADPFEPFTNERRGGFGYFLNNFRVGQPSGRLSLYLLDQLYGHFEAVLPPAVAR
ncbi:MAG: hypothetical protein KC910_10940, partial [Candidatus Eremiobacteraeota bacterium]|nr:hypothetical protein [Candidatus Eremiobacteraeota bacterium]